MTWGAIDSTTCEVAESESNLAAFVSAGEALEKTKMVHIICETHLNSEVNFKKSIVFLRF